MRKLIGIIALILLFSSCDKNEKSTSRSEVEIYLLQSHELITGKCAVNPLGTVLQQTPIVSNNDILRYSRSSYTYKLTDAAFERIRALVGRTPFALTVDRKVVFYGIYMPSFMSSTCFHSITMDIKDFTNKEIYLRLGYPGSIETSGIEDQRNHELIVQAFRNQGKLR